MAQSPERIACPYLVVTEPSRSGTYLLDDGPLDWLAQVGVSAMVHGDVVAHLLRDTQLNHTTLRTLPDAQIPWLGPQQRSRAYEALAIAAYHRQTTLPVVRLLVCDDAGQFIVVTLSRALC